MRRTLTTTICLLVLLVGRVGLADASADAKAAAAADQAEADLTPALPERPKPKSLDELLKLVKEGFQEERAENKRREEEFKQAKDQQQRLLSEALAKRERLSALSERLETSYTENEGLIGKLQARLTEQLGQMGELFGVVRQVANDLSGQVWESVTSSQLEPRKKLLDRLGRSKDVPTTDDLQRLWYELQQEMTEQGKVVRYTAKVLMENGQLEPHEVIRAGVFNVISNGKYLAWESRDQQLRELTRQPPSRSLDTVEPFEKTKTGYAPLALDPSRGALLAALIETPSSTERIQQGGYVGYVIIVLGVFALLLGVIRWVGITITARKVAMQRKSDRADPGNPLGRVLAVYDKNRDVDPETLELKLDEAVLRETSRLERFIWVVKVVSVVAPLLGLLGTVTGMIKTFQAITLFGAGDPKMMAGGISEALVTTMLGLIAAIPLVLLHATLASGARRITDTLDAQSAGLIALRSENARDGV